MQCVAYFPFPSIHNQKKKKGIHKISLFQDLTLTLLNTLSSKGATLELNLEREKLCVEQMIQNNCKGTTGDDTKICLKYILSGSSHPMSHFTNL